MINVQLIPVLKDNYAYVIHADNGDVAVIDPGASEPILDYLATHKLKPSIIFNTHHHGDHIAGNPAIIEKYGCPLAGPKHETLIPGVTILLSENMKLRFGDEELVILDTPGHTKYHACLYFPQSKILFTGDTLFSMGCGRLFEESAKVMWKSLQKIKALPDDTMIYCGHEYTLSNAQFCLHVEPGNIDTIKRNNEAKALREKGFPTLPVSLGEERRTNVFLKAKNAEAFADLRTLKDSF